MATAITGASTLDVQSIVSQLMSAERQPIDALNSNITSVQAKITAFGTLKSSLSTLQAAAQAMATAQSVSAIGLKTSSTDVNIASASVVSGASTAPHTITIDKLAQPQKVLSTGFPASSSKVGDGSLSIQPGKYNESGVFVAEDGKPAIVFDLSGISMTEAANKINSANSPVLASPVFDGSQWRLTFTSRETGSAGGFTLESVPTSGSENPLNISFGVNASGHETGTGTRVSSAQDSSFTLDGMKMTRPTNRIDDAVPGVSIQIGKVSQDPVTITITRETEALKKSMDAFITAYNGLNATVKNLSPTAVGQSGPLRGDMTVASILSSVRSVLLKGVDSSSIGNLSGLGISVIVGGNLSLDSKKFNAASADSTQFSNLMVGNNGSGIASGLNTKIASILSMDGSITTKTSGLQKTVKGIKNKISALEIKMVTAQKKYTNQYTRLNAEITNMQTMSARLSSTFG